METWMIIVLGFLGWFTLGFLGVVFMRLQYHLTGKAWTVWHRSHFLVMGIVCGAVPFVLEGAGLLSALLARGKKEDDEVWF